MLDLAQTLFMSNWSLRRPIIAIGRRKQAEKNVSNRCSRCRSERRSSLYRCRPFSLARTSLGTAHSRAGVTCGFNLAVQTPTDKIKVLCRTHVPCSASDVWRIETARGKRKLRKTTCCGHARAIAHAHDVRKSRCPRDDWRETILSQTSELLIYIFIYFISSSRKDKGLWADADMSQLINWKTVTLSAVRKVQSLVICCWVCGSDEPTVRRGWLTYERIQKFLRRGFGCNCILHWLLTPLCLNDWRQLIASISFMISHMLTLLEMKFSVN